MELKYTNTRFAATLAAFTGDLGTVSGKITTASTGRAIVGAKVSPAGSATQYTLTDSNGNYSLLLPPGACQIKASTTGYEDQTASITIVTNGTVTKNFSFGTGVGTTRLSQLAGISDGTSVSITATKVVSAADRSYIYIDDGSGSSDGNSGGYMGVKVMLSGLVSPITKQISTNPYPYVNIIGLRGLAKDESTIIPVIRPRSNSDITIE